MTLLKSKLEPYRPCGLHGPQYKPFSRTMTSYANMNDWMAMQDKPQHGNIPITVTDGNWKYVRSNPDAVPAAPSAAAFAIPDNNDYFSRYLQLADKKAYRFPDPGVQRFREGNIGGSWRHVKQVLGQSGSNLVYVDGLVRLYDHSHLNANLTSRSLPTDAKVATPLYAINRNDVSSYKKYRTQEMEKRNFRPWMVQKHTRILPLYDAEPPCRYTQPNTVPNMEDRGRRGFYQRNK